jgi:hypothetical protein
MRMVIIMKENLNKVKNTDRVFILIKGLDKFMMDNMFKIKKPEKENLLLVLDLFIKGVLKMVNIMEMDI